VQEDNLIGTQLANYTILAPLGQGGMARVYRAHQENLDREVAIKVLPPWYAADRNFVERFKLEARLVGRLSHPNIVTVHDASEYHGHLYIVMQLVDGGTLKQRLDALREQGKMMEVSEANRTFQQIAGALSYAHEHSIIHRDIKPVNVLMDRSGRPILSDFGIAKALEGTKELTRPGAGVGTPEYMSPEQCMGAPVDGRADIYALGVMLFEALTGRTPFIGENYPALAHSHIYEEPPDPRLFNPRISLEVAQVILTALRKKPELRYQTAHEMAVALEHAAHPLAPLIETRSANPTPPAPPGPYAGTPPAPIYRAPTTPLFACPNCQHPNKPDVFYCIRCGSPLNRCWNCGKQNRARDRFCTQCGEKLKT
jgi:serine/threonine protein kinase